MPANTRLIALDFPANRETVTKTDLSQYLMRHFATHGILNSEHPELSGLVLSLVVMYAGSLRVVASLLKVEDVATAELMKRFYRGMLQQGQRPAAALRAAQLEMLTKRQWAHPFYWAAFTLQGEWK